MGLVLLLILWFLTGDWFVQFPVRPRVGEVKMAGLVVIEDEWEYRVLHQIVETEKQDIDENYDNRVERIQESGEERESASQLIQA